MAFADALEKEKQYAKDYVEHGLGSTELSDKANWKNQSQFLSNHRR